MSVYLIYGEKLGARSRRRFRARTAAGLYKLLAKGLPTQQGLYAVLAAHAFECGLTEKASISFAYQYFNKGEVTLGELRDEIDRAVYYGYWPAPKGEVSTSVTTATTTDVRKPHSAPALEADFFKASS